MANGPGLPGESIDHVENLTKALDDPEAFAKAFVALKQDKTADVKQIARDFAKVRPLSKGDAYDRIWSRHSSLMADAARYKRVGERTAG